jgi:hypothetical protein
MGEHLIETERNGKQKFEGRAIWLALRPPLARFRIAQDFATDAMHFNE